METVFSFEMEAININDSQVNTTMDNVFQSSGISATVEDLEKYYNDVQQIESTMEQMEVPDA